MLQTSRRKIGQCLLTLIRLHPGQSRELSLTSRILFCKTQPLKEESKYNTNNEQTTDTCDNEASSPNLKTEKSANISDFYEQLQPKSKRIERTVDNDFEAIHKLRSSGDFGKNFRDARKTQFQRTENFPRKSPNFDLNPWLEHQEQGSKSYGRFSYSKHDFGHQNLEVESFIGSCAKEGSNPVTKNFYSEHSDVTNRPQKEVDEFLKKHEIILTGRDIPRPIFTVQESGFPDLIQQYFRKQKFTDPTHIQSVTWPIVSSGRDCIGIAQTGSGKTLSYALPALVHVSNQEAHRPGDGPIALILVPTRELVQQVVQVMRKFADNLDLSIAATYGGTAKFSQLKELCRSHICVATPGRLNDFLQSEKTNMDRCTFLVLDEADRMLDMGFEDQINMIIKEITTERQTVMWSATWPEEVQDLAKRYLQDPIQVNVGSSELTVNKDITHDIRLMDVSEKFAAVENILMSLNPSCKVLMFTDTKISADWLRNKLSSGMGGCIESLHGDKSQYERDRIMKDFKYGRKPLLVATDVASRGLDVNDITHIINYNFPRDIESYVHRIGRTGRAGKKGTAISFLSVQDSFARNPKSVQKLVKLLQDADQNINPELFHICSSQGRQREVREKPKYRIYTYRDDYTNFKPRGFSYKRGGNNPVVYEGQSYRQRQDLNRNKYDDDDFS